MASERALKQRAIRPRPRPATRKGDRRLVDDSKGTVVYDHNGGRGWRRLGREGAVK